MNDYQRLKDLLVGDERAELEKQEARLEKLERERAALPRDLPRLLRDAQRGDGRDKLADALAPPLAQAFGTAVREEPRQIVDALFPVIGPAIRRAIAEALRDFSDGFNRALESSFTPRGLKWRFESWRTGVPYAQVVLKHTLSFRLYHLFLIERDSGLVLARESTPELADLDADAIAGMLTAIGDFVRDSVGGDAHGNGGSLASATVGEHVLWVVEGPRANLAVFLRGVPPAQLRLILEERLERIHALMPDASADAGGVAPAVREALALDRLRSAAAADPSVLPRRRSRRWPLLLAFAAIVVLLGAWLVRDWLWVRHLQEVEAVARSWPGVHIDGIDGSTRGAVVVRGLLDPLAESPRAAIAARLPPGTTLAFEWRGYVSTDPALVVRRAKQLLAPPDGVRVEFADGRLTLRGVAPAQWVAAARERAPWIAGVAALDADQLRAAEDPAAALQAELDAIDEKLQALRVDFARETEAVDTAPLDAMATLVRRALELGAALKLDLRVRCHGQNDAPGGNALNRRLRERRAEWLCAELAQRGVAPEAFASHDDADAVEPPTIAVRAATLRLERARKEQP